MLLKKFQTIGVIMLCIAILFGLFGCNGTVLTGKNTALTVADFISAVLKQLGYQFDDRQQYIDKGFDLEIIKPVEEPTLQQKISKQQAAQIAIRSIRDPEGFDANYLGCRKYIKDYNKIDEKYRDAVLRACAKGIVFEEDNGKFNPKQTINSEQANQIISRILYKENRRKAYNVPAEKYLPVIFDWQACDKDEDIIPSPIWAPGEPEFSLDKENKTEGTASVRVDYTVASNAWHLVCFSPNIASDTSFYEYGGLEFDFYNPDSYEKNLQFRIDDMEGNNYFIRSMDEEIYSHYGRFSSVPAGPGWVKIRFYFDSVHEKSTMLPASNRDMLKKINKIMIVVQDNGGNENNAPETKKGYFLLDNARFFNIEQIKAEQTADRLPEDFQKSDDRYEKSQSLLKAAKVFESQNQWMNAVKEYTKILELSSYHKASREKITQIYEKKLNANEKNQYRDQLKQLYNNWRTDDLEKAQGITKLHQELTGIYSDEQPLFSFGAVTQTIGPYYSFTENDRLFETASILRDMGTDTIKMRMGVNYPGDYQIPADASVQSLTTLAQYSSYKKVLDMPFNNYLIWTYPFRASSWWDQGPTSQAVMEGEYKEIYEFTKYLLTTYNNTGKTFLLGNWEGDWHLCTFDMLAPSLKKIYGITEWFRMRQKAVTDAVADTQHTNVNVHFYMELNVFSYDDIKGNAPRLMNTVLPYVNVDLVSFSSYQTTGIGPIVTGNMPQYFKTAMDYIEKQTPPGDIPGKRLWVGEYGFPLVDNIIAEEQDEYMRQVLREGFKWGAPFMLYWQVYCNEYNNVIKGNNGFWLIDSNNEKQPTYYTLERISKKAKEFVDAFAAENGRKPTQQEYYQTAIGWLD